MTERPILFSAPMVRAVLDGSKMQTRRAVRHQAPALPPGWRWERLGVEGWYPVNGPYRSGGIGRCPYGQPGDRLWVRESLRHGLLGHCYAASHGDGVASMVDYELEPPPSVGLPARAIPSIHMPRWASRISLDVVNVRVERLQDISEADAMAEAPPAHPGSPAVDYRNQIAAFGALWSLINGPDAWDANPWVWAISFRRIKP